jgi:DNA-binding FadR family transcriptional regulator
MSRPADAPAISENGRAVPNKAAIADPDAFVYGGLFSPVRGRNVFEEALGRVLEALKTGAFAPGDRLPSERELAGLLEVSRPTVREVMRALQSSGHVVLRRGRTGGAYVLPPRTADADRDPYQVAREMKHLVLDALDFRWAVEPAAAEFAAERIDEDGLEGLRQRQARCRSAHGREYRPADVQLHLEIARASRCLSLVKAVASTQATLTDLFAATPVVERAIRHSDEQHDAIYDAIASGDRAAARSAMEEHLDATAQFLRGFLG